MALFSENDARLIDVFDMIVSRLDGLDAKIEQMHADVGCMRSMLRARDVNEMSASNAVSTAALWGLPGHVKTFRLSHCKEANDYYVACCCTCAPGMLDTLRGWAVAAEEEQRSVYLHPEERALSDALLRHVHQKQRNDIFFADAYVDCETNDITLIFGCKNGNRNMLSDLEGVSFLINDLLFCTFGSIPSRTHIYLASISAIERNLVRYVMVGSINESYFWHEILPQLRASFDKQSIDNHLLPSLLYGTLDGIKYAFGFYLLCENVKLQRLVMYLRGR